MLTSTIIMRSHPAMLAVATTNLFWVIGMPVLAMAVTIGLCLAIYRVLGGVFGR